MGIEFCGVIQVSTSHPIPPHRAFLRSLRTPEASWVSSRHDRGDVRALSRNCDRCGHRERGGFARFSLRNEKPKFFRVLGFQFPLGVQYDRDFLKHAADPFESLGKDLREAATLESFVDLQLGRVKDVPSALMAHAVG